MHHHQGEESLPKKEAHAHTGMTMDHNEHGGGHGHDHHAMMINDFKKRFYV